MPQNKKCTSKSFAITACSRVIQYVAHMQRCFSLPFSCFLFVCYLVHGVTVETMQSNCGMKNQCTVHFVFDTLYHICLPHIKLRKGCLTYSDQWAQRFHSFAIGENCNFHAFLHSIIIRAHSVCDQIKSDRI